MAVMSVLHVKLGATLQLAVRHVLHVQWELTPMQALHLVQSVQRVSLLQVKGVQRVVIVLQGRFLVLGLQNALNGRLGHTRMKDLHPVPTALLGPSVG